MNPPPANPLILDPRAIPSRGLTLTGQVSKDVFILGDDKWIIPQPPLEYNISVHRSGDLLLVEGQVKCRFRMKCTRCLEWFVDLVEINPYQAEVEIEDEISNTDLTERLREDILLALPGFPRCDDSAVEPRKCPAEEVLRQLDTDAGPSGEQDQRAWGALDHLKVDRPSPPTES